MSATEKEAKEEEIQPAAVVRVAVVRTVVRLAVVRLAMVRPLGIDSKDLWWRWKSLGNQKTAMDSDGQCCLE